MQHLSLKRAIERGRLTVRLNVQRRISSSFLGVALFGIIPRAMRVLPMIAGPKITGRGSKKREPAVWRMAY